MAPEDGRAGNAVTAVIAHLAHSTPPDGQFTAADFNIRAAAGLAEGAPRRVNGRTAAGTRPAPGITPRLEVPGEPVLGIG